MAMAMAIAMASFVSVEHLAEHGQSSRRPSSGQRVQRAAIGADVVCGHQLSPDVTQHKSNTGFRFDCNLIVICPTVCVSRVRHVYDQIRVRPRSQHLLTRRPTLSGRVRHRSHQSMCPSLLPVNQRQIIISSDPQLGSTAIGIQSTEGVVLAVEKRVTSTLMEPAATEKISEIDKHVGCAVSGLMADSRTMVDRARVEAQVCLGLSLNFSENNFLFCSSRTIGFYTTRRCLWSR